MDTFREDAEKGNQELLKVAQVMEWRIELAKNPNSVYDAMIQNTIGHIFYVETKHRSRKYEEMILEEKKALALIRAVRTNKNVMGIIYVNTFDDGTAALWHITKHLLEDSQYELKECRWHTSSDDGNKMKKVYLLKISAAKTIKYK